MRYEKLLCFRYGGNSVYTWDNGDTFSGHIDDDGVREGSGVVTSPDNSIDILSGDWVCGRLEGLGRIVYTDSSITEA